MLRKIRIMGLVLVLLIALCASTATTASWLFLRGQPTWYEQATAEPGRAGSAERMERKLITLYDRVAAVHAWRVRQQANVPPHVSLTTAASVNAAQGNEQPFVITFSDAELNAFFEKWVDSDGRREAMASFVENPRLQVRSGEMILAARVKQFHTVISIDLMPSLDATGRLQMNLHRVYGGILPLPEPLWASERERIVQAMNVKYAAYQPELGIAPDGTANPAAAAAGMNRLLVATLEHQPANPVLFLPYDVRRMGRTVPTKVESIKLDDGTLTLNVREMSTRERDALLTTMRNPDAQKNAEPRR